MKRKWIIPLLLLVIAGTLLGRVNVSALTGYTLDWWTVDGGGATTSTGGSYGLGGSIGQPDAGTSNGGTYALDGGFWGGAADVIVPTATPTATDTPTNTPVPPTATNTPTNTPPVVKTLTYQSLAANDGWVLESTATSNAGGTFNATTATFNLGDTASKQEYRGILHFDTSSLPDNAVITSVTLKIRKSPGGSGNTSTLGKLLADIRKPSFGTVTLAKTDFQATGTAGAGIFGAPVSNWYSSVLTAVGRANINKIGTTQFRLRFTKGDDADALADFLLFYSGNAGAASRPQLIIQYYVP